MFASAPVKGADVMVLTRRVGVGNVVLKSEGEKRANVSLFGASSKKKRENRRTPGASGRADVPS